MSSSMLRCPEPGTKQFGAMGNMDRLTDKSTVNAAFIPHSPPASPELLWPELTKELREANDGSALPRRKICLHQLVPANSNLINAITNISFIFAVGTE